MLGFTDSNSKTEWSSMYDCTWEPCWTHVQRNTTPESSQATQPLLEQDNFHARSFAFWETRSQTSEAHPHWLPIGSSANHHQWDGRPRLGRRSTPYTPPFINSPTQLDSDQKTHPCVSLAISLPIDIQRESASTPNIPPSDRVPNLPSPSRSCQCVSDSPSPWLSRVKIPRPFTLTTDSGSIPWEKKGKKIVHCPRRCMINFRIQSTH